jgi:hypothetical protein
MNLVCIKNNPFNEESVLLFRKFFRNPKFFHLDSYAEVRFFGFKGESLPLASKKQTKHAWFLAFFPLPLLREIFLLSRSDSICLY